ncbi:unnamed protein product [Rotaria magnacalcarata]|nr:unnamed protein product [Rotaria magnacalcarata]
MNNCLMLIRLAQSHPHSLRQCKLKNTTKLTRFCSRGASSRRSSHGCGRCSGCCSDRRRLSHRCGRCSGCCGSDRRTST